LCDYDDILGTEIKLTDHEYASPPDNSISHAGQLQLKMPGKEPRHPIVSKKKNHGKGTIGKLKEEILSPKRKEFLKKKNARWYNKGRYCK